mmetsp:Transcript_94081/g.263328  ORF Transcript_94081/g.263328 Transcript_94081/m.263328 type:complete len:529 (+) Transcript_94081:84-1670(+)
MFWSCGRCSVQGTALADPTEDTEVTVTTEDASPQEVDLRTPLSVVIFGATGDLAKKKLYPALCQLMFACPDAPLLPPTTNIIGYARTKIALPDFLQKQGVNVSERHREAFFSRCSYIAGGYDSEPDYQRLHEHLCALEGHAKANRIFFFSVNPEAFAVICRCVKAKACAPAGGYTRLIIEKPFGRDSKSFAELDAATSSCFPESSLFRIDHYLGKEVVLNLVTLRFGNQVFEPLWNRESIASVQITFKEDLGTGGRGGYFDGFGIIRDIMQNHLMQVLTLVAMEAPASLVAEDVRDEKVKVLKQIRPIDPKDCVVGQYDGYQDDADIKKLNEQKGYASRCPTFAAVVLYLDNERWSGVPFIMKAGKALETQQTIVRIQFKKAPPNSLFGDQPQNELVIRIQPNEAIYYKILAKLPGLTQRARDVQQTVLDLDLKKRFELRRTPEAYEKLIHDVIQGESHNFVRRDELEQAWRIFDPLLHELEVTEKRVPERYTFGSRGPLKADALIDRMGFRRYTVTGVPGFAEDDFD